MKNIVLAAAAAVAVFAAAPASAQVRCYLNQGCSGSYSAPDAYQYDQQRGYPGGYYPGQPTLVDALIISLFRHKASICYTANGQMIARRGKTWTMVSGSDADKVRNTGAVAAQCDGSTYVTVAQPESAPQTAAPSHTNGTPWMERIGGDLYTCRFENSQKVCRAGN